MTQHPTPSGSTDLLEKALGYTFTDRGLLDLALTHTSWANEKAADHGQKTRHENIRNNERLEFLGDAVLELCVSNILFHSFPSLREGSLTKIRSSLVSTTNFANMAKTLGINHLIKLGKGEELQGGRERDSVLSDAFEAVIAAVYEDGGYKAAMKTIEGLFHTYWNQDWDAETVKDNKTSLQELVQQRFKTTPLYQLTKSDGPDHAKTFTVQLTLPDGAVFQATGTSCKKAEQEAAGKALLYCANL
ncbi:MAG: ribonuclease III [Desulfovibrio sp.]|nr:ribonuclease III [Desulfovibrio sp.]